MQRETMSPISLSRFNGRVQQSLTPLHIPASR
jgi:hypothetical protein